MYEFFTFLAGLAIVAMVVGLVKPRIVRLKGRKRVVSYGLGAAVAMSVLAVLVESDEHRQTRLQEEAAAARERARQDSIEFAQFSDHEKETKWAATVLPKEDRWAAYQMTEKFVKQVMLTPDSVDFPSFNGYSDEDADMVMASDDVWEYQGTHYRQYHVQTTFKAQNRYGATIRYKMNCWVYNSSADKDHWKRFKMNIVDPSLQWTDPNFRIFEVDPEDSEKPRRAEMPTGWSPTSQVN